MKKKLLLWSGLLTVSHTCFGQDENMARDIACWIASKGLFFGIIGAGLYEGFGPKSGFWPKNVSPDVRGLASSVLTGNSIRNTTDNTSRRETTVVLPPAEVIQQQQAPRVDTVEVTAAAGETAAGSASVENLPADTRSLGQRAAQKIENIGQAAHNAAQKVNRGVKTTIDVVTWPYKKAVQAKDFCCNPEHRPYFAAAGTFVGTMALLDLRHERACIGDYTRDVVFSSIVAGAMGYVVHKIKRDAVRIRDMEGELKQVKEEVAQLRTAMGEGFAQQRQLMAEHQEATEARFGQVLGQIDDVGTQLTELTQASRKEHDQLSKQAEDNQVETNTALRAIAEQQEKLNTVVTDQHTQLDKKIEILHAKVEEGFGAQQARDREMKEEQASQAQLGAQHRKHLSDKADAAEAALTALTRTVRGLQTQVAEGNTASNKAAEAAQEAAQNSVQTKQLVQGLVEQLKSQQQQTLVFPGSSPKKSISTTASPGKGNGTSFDLSTLDFSKLRSSRLLPRTSVVE